MFVIEEISLINSKHVDPMYFTWFKRKNTHTHGGEMFFCPDTNQIQKRERKILNKKKEIFFFRTNWSMIIVTLSRIFLKEKMKNNLFDQSLQSISVVNYSVFIFVFHRIFDRSLPINVRVCQSFLKESICKIKSPQIIFFFIKPFHRMNISSSCIVAEYHARNPSEINEKNSEYHYADQNGLQKT